MQNKVLLIILDGWGLSPLQEGNATFLAKTPVLDKVYANYPKISLAASGTEVGLHAGEMGNSEVGHLNIGSGRVVWEMKPKIDEEIRTGQFFDNQTLRQTAEYLKESGGRLQLVGLCSNGGVHSSINHILSLIDFAVGEDIKSLYLHLFTDGRDTGPKVASQFISQVENKLNSTKLGKISSLIGRYYAMDRDNNWQRVEAAYNLILNGVGRGFNSALAAIDDNYKRGKGDEYIEPSIIDPEGCVKAGDAIVFFNFREDRSRQLLQAFEDPEFKQFQRQKLNDVFLVSMTKYFEEEKSAVIIPPNNLENVLADVIERAGMRQYHTAETEKYAHVTYFFNGGSHRVHQFEKQILVDSPKVATYDLKPEMSADGVSEKVIEAVGQEQDFIVVNFANGDMVGHTGKLEAAIKAVEKIDYDLEKVLFEASKFGYQVLITADHGNCEIMLNPVDNQPYTEHTTSPVPLCFLDLRKQPFSLSLPKNFSREELYEYSKNPFTATLADIAPTIIDILGLQIPSEMDGRSFVNYLV